MSYIRISIAVIILLATFSLSRGQASDPNVEWYKGFFQREKNEPASIVLEKSTEQLEAAKESRDFNAQARAYTAIGLVYLTRFRESEKAMDFLIKSLAIEDSLSLKGEQIFSYLAIARIFEDVGNYNRSAEFLEQALLLNEAFNNNNVLVLILNQLGKVNAARGRIDKAFENYENALDDENEIDQTQEAEVLYNLGNLYNQQKEYQKALSSYKKALQIWRAIKDRKNESISLNDIGKIYQHLKNYDRALANHLAALDIQQGMDDKNGIAESYNDIGMLYYEQKNYERAVANLNLALRAGQESQSQEQQKRSYEYLSQCYNQLANYKEAFRYQTLFIAINDLILGDQNDRQLLEAQSRYSLEKKESQIDKLESERVKKEREIEDQKKFRNILYLIIALIVVIVLLISYFYTQKRRSNRILQATNEMVKMQNMQLQNLNATKDKFFSIISHDLKGPLNSLTSFSGLLINHTESLSKEEIQMLAKDLDKSVKNLFALLENLLEWSRSQTGNIDLKPEVFDITTMVESNKELLQSQAQGKQIALISNLETGLQVKADKNSVSTVIRNLISNAIKFTPPGGTVSIDVEQREHQVILSVRDTGVGMSADVMDKLFRIDVKHSTKGTADEKGTGLGLILCKDFIEKNGGKIWVKSEINSGSTFSFTLPSY